MPLLISFLNPLGSLYPNYSVIYYGNYYQPNCWAFYILYEISMNTNKSKNDKIFIQKSTNYTTYAAGYLMQNLLNFQKEFSSKN